MLKLLIPLLSLVTSISYAAQQGAPATAPAAQNPQSTGVNIEMTEFKNIRNSFFEVVYNWKKYDNYGVEYEKPLPYEKLPFYLKNSDTIAIGAAFAIGNGQILSAAHLFNVHLESFINKSISLKAYDGKIYQIDKILKYGQHEDLILFTLKKYPKNIPSLKTTTKSKVSENVYTVGNSLGQGIIVRNGILTSYTPEERDGKWNFIRYTAPASPGNSGGALINKDGEVLGVVTRKSASENLNFAVPIAQLDRLPKDKALFFERKFGETESHLTQVTDWTDQTPLPAGYKPFLQTASKKYIQGFHQRRKEFEAKYHQQLFPQDAKLPIYLHNQGLHEYFMKIEKSESGLWQGLSSTDLKAFTIGKDQNVVAALIRQIGKQVSFEMYVDKPHNVGMKEFLAKPKYLIEGIFKALPFDRVVASQKIKLTKLGPPETNEWWQDSFGRKWRTSVWPLAFEDTAIVANCLPLPKTLGCSVESVPYWFRSMATYYHKIVTQRTLVAYRGKLKEWNEFLQLPKEYLPIFLQKGPMLKRKKEQLTLKLGRFAGKVQNKHMSEETFIELYFELNPYDSSKLITKYLTVIPDSEKPDIYALITMHSPHPENNEEFHKNWGKMLKGEEPFDGSTLEKDNVYTAKLAKIPDKKKKDIKGAVLYFCDQDKNRLSKEEAKKRCATFYQSVTSAPADNW